jgi:carbonic anhydrase
MRVLKSFLIVCCLASVVGLGYAKMAVQADPLLRLFEGNKLFVADAPAVKEVGQTRREELSRGQHPFATVITCSDSRVAPEYIFDQGLGDIFVVRVAGNVVEPTTLGSIEYAAEHLHTPLLVIMGHSQCGAVKAAVEAKGKPEGNIGAILKKIMPAVKTAKQAKKSSDETLELAIQENVKNTYKDIMKSPIVSHLVKEGKLKIIAAEYQLKDGKVETIELSQAAVPAMHHKH